MYDIERIIIGPASEEFPGNHSASLVELGDGTLLIFWMRFIKSPLAGNDHAPNRIVSARSRDGGRTWDEPRIEAEPLPGDVNVYNPSILRLTSGEILFFYYRHLELEWQKPFKTSSYLRRSADNGLSFSEPVNMWEGQPFGCANSRMIRLSTGRLVLPVGQTLIWGGPKDNQKSTCFMSDDEGRTWRQSPSLLYLPLRGTLEAHVAEANDASLVMTMRTQIGSVFISRSTDFGESWSKPQTTGLKSPESMPCLSRIPSTGDLLLVWNDSEFDPAFDHLGRRSPLTCAISRDSGRTWCRALDLETDPAIEFTNPSCCFTRDGKAIITYMSSPMQNPDPPGKLGRSRMSLKAVIMDVETLYRKTS